MDWKEDIRRGFKDHNSLASFLDRPLPSVSYPIFIPYLLALRLKHAHPDSALARQFLPNALEDGPEQAAGELDPIADQAHSPVPGLVHRYDNRALFFPTQVCPVQCRYCFRKNELGQGLDTFRPQWEAIATYLRAHPEIEEIIFSGGDPLILDDQRLNFYIEQLLAIPSVRFLRFHTRVPTTLPSRITPELISLLERAQSKFEAVTLVAHINHPEEWADPMVTDALGLLRQSRLQLLAQSVLLAGVNDSLETLAELWRGLSARGLRPYYLHHPDPAKGALHFMVSPEHGLKLMHTLRRQLPGWMLPHYVIETPQGGGKTLV